MEDTFLLEKEGKPLANSPQTGTHHPASRCQMGIQGLGFCRMQLMKGNPSFISSMDKMGQKAAAHSLCALLPSKKAYPYGTSPYQLTDR